MAQARRDLVALGSVLIVLAVGNISRSIIVPDTAQLATNLALATAIVAIGWWSGLRTADLGLRPERLAAGNRLGLVAAALIALVVIGAGVVSTQVASLAERFADDRVDIGPGALLVRIVLIIPVGTVLVEEIIFRGVILALLVRILRPAGAIVAAAVIFGLWHIFPTWWADRTLDGLGAAAGTFVATTLAGFGFVWLRRRPDSLIAPIWAHVATNSVTFAVAWFLAR